MKFYLRVEGVNLGNFVFDTQDLSTVRGGSLLLLDSMERLQSSELPASLCPVSTGASSGLFAFDADSRTSAEAVREAVKSFLSTDEALRHATFVVDVLAAQSDFVTTRESLLAANRWRQMKAPSVAVPSLNSKTGVEACDIDHVRPGLEPGPGGNPVSRSAYIRREYGREQRQGFYHRETGVDNLPPFVNDFGELTEDQSRGNLHHKMAVIYLDGNGFGAIQNELCQSEEDQRGFNQTIKSLRSKLLQKLLQATVGKPEWTTSAGQHRMETLLWGGDEILWVVPGWLGWWALQFFYEHSREWEFKNQTGNARPLTHAAGLVFCHHKAPIHRITRLGHDLASLAKMRSKTNLLAYQILESFDHAGPDRDHLIRFRQQRCPRNIDHLDLLVAGDKMASITEHMKAVKNEFPRNKLHAIAQSLVSDSGERGAGAAAGISTAETELSPAAQKHLADLSGCFPHESVRWLHLAELWDYVDSF